MYSMLYRNVKSTWCSAKHIGQWFSLNFDNQDIELHTENSSAEIDRSAVDVGVYFIHGTGDQACSFQTMARRLKRDGLNKSVASLHLVAFHGRYQGNDIDHFAKQLLDKINIKGHKRVVLCGHSRGALVASYFAEYLAANAKIEVLHCISICRPFRGSYLAAPPLSFISASVKQMAKGSDFLQLLQNKINSEPACPYTFIIAKADWIVPNRCGYILAYKEKHPDSVHEFKDHSHISIMTSTTVSRLLHTIINDAVGPEQIQGAVMTTRYVP